jgi:hypothetical protein
MVAMRVVLVLVALGVVGCGGLGHAPGALACNATCDGFDATGCDGGFVAAAAGFTGKPCFDGVKFGQPGVLAPHLVVCNGSRPRSGPARAPATAWWWTNLGGDFNATEIASTTFLSPFSVGQTCSWSSSGMVNDVQGWVNSSSSYHGWMIKSDLETTATSFLGWWTVDGATANVNMNLQPILHVEWH